MTKWNIDALTRCTAEQTAAVAALEELCGVRVGVEYLAARKGDLPQDFLCFQDEQLIGYLSWSSNDGIVAVINGMVHPDHRRQGVFSQLLQAAENVFAAQGIHSLLFIVPADSRSGRSFAERQGAVYRNAEYAMQYAASSAPELNSTVALRPATEADVDFMVTCIMQAFGDTEEWTRAYLTSTDRPNRTNLIVLQDGEPCGLVRITYGTGGQALLHDLAVLPDRQGRGIGRHMLAQAIERLLAEGMRQIQLSVVTDNEHALGLYKRAGFAITSCEQFYGRDSRLAAITAFSPEEAAAVAALEELCNTAEGMNLRIGTEYLLSRSGDQPYDFLYYENGQLLGFLCWFTMDGKEAEINGMVHPDHRRRGIFKKLLAAADAEMRKHGIESRLYLVNPQSRSGLAFLEHLGGAFRHAEYTMQLQEFLPPSTRDEALCLRPAAEADLEFMVTCAAQAFGDPEDWMRDLLLSTSGPERTTYIAELEGTPVAMIRVLRSTEGIADIHGFSVLPALRGRGYGRQILADTVELLLQEQRTRICLDVLTDNERALQLYESLGFSVISACRYYAG
ncbi:ribosomal protein S18 acetylase RimI-like enzyme [Tumebacillus sp. BK434]|uniref:GNAT family N-acetyltransferase n=1 Tax=Tumebacillus sp. BK434 TaxID=2512169 RepID=UPI001049F9B5|nr:GNAT family N-acetyltransferase [Tumebacillus sp. BK434]TCP52154.1 ribosomal protein S18 acetylase RimI-like enzyme [Tumebacillus sp. BK434]